MSVYVGKPNNNGWYNFPCCSCGEFFAQKDLRTVPPPTGRPYCVACVKKLDVSPSKKEDYLQSYWDWNFCDT